MNREDALNAACIRITTTTALPDDLKAKAKSTAKPTSISRKLAGEALIHVTKKSGVCHAAHMKPTQMAATQGRITCSR